MVEKNILVSSIDFSERTYKISKNFLRSELAVSVKNFGILRAPAVFPFGGGFRILTGYNRVEAARMAGFENIPACVYEKPSSDVLAREAELKFFSGEIGPAGKLRLLSLLKNTFCADEDFIVKTCHAGLGLPERVFDKAWLDNFERLEEPVKDYFDNKDAPFNLIDMYMSLPPDFAQSLAQALELFPIRINIFRKITAMLLDIARRGGSSDFIFDAKIAGRQGEQEFLNAVFQERYPEYSAMKRRCNEIISALSGSGIGFEFPEFFEGGRLSVKFALNKRDSLKSLFEKAGRIDESLFRELLDML